MFAQLKKFLAAISMTAVLSVAAFAQDGTAPKEAPANVGKIQTSNLFQVLYDGGPVMWPIAACSIILGVFVLERFVMLRRARVLPKPFVQKFMEQLRGGQLGRDSALELCEENGSPVARVFAGAIKKWGRPAVEVEQAVIDAGERVTYELRKYLRLFNGISSIGPLLGLLGTVMGMIAAFNSIGGGNSMGKAESLAGGIGQALLATAGGLIVAIPALCAYMFFQSRVEVLIMDIDAASQQVIDVVSAEGAESAKSANKRKAA
jgi:biopolymer transport protein ExbB